MKILLANRLRTIRRLKGAAYLIPLLATFEYALANEQVAASGDQRSPNSESESLWKADDKRRILEAVNSQSPDPARKLGATRAEILQTFDRLMPGIENSCQDRPTLVIGLFKLGFALSLEKPGALEDLVDLASNLAKITPQEAQGLTPKCRSDVKFLGVQVQKELLGGSWDPPGSQLAPAAPQPQQRHVESNGATLPRWSGQNFEGNISRQRKNTPPPSQIRNLDRSN